MAVFTPGKHCQATPLDDPPRRFPRTGGDRIAHCSTGLALLQESLSGPVEDRSGTGTDQGEVVMLTGSGGRGGDVGVDRDGRCRWSGM
ncbi:hypothetical protein E2C01_076593 [Portunus trituberculatus]|uniref:Uncharacterized protein n=1 Tax=Portunus trituberculatus TaxID=210409 RepID=A0A5B7I936_PORTR|nr:hypothetical protein [Portunus trituberculatus]